MLKKSLLIGSLLFASSAFSEEQNSIDLSKALVSRHCFLDETIARCFVQIADKNYVARIIKEEDEDSMRTHFSSFVFSVFSSEQYESAERRAVLNFDPTLLRRSMMTQAEFDAALAACQSEAEVLAAIASTTAKAGVFLTAELVAKNPKLAGLITIAADKPIDAIAGTIQTWLANNCITGINTGTNPIDFSQPVIVVLPPPPVIVLPDPVVIPEPPVYVPEPVVLPPPPVYVPEPVVIPPITIPEPPIFVMPPIVFPPFSF